MNVVAVVLEDWKKEDGSVTKVTKATFDDGRTISGYDLPTLLEAGKPLPDGWEVATSKAGKPYIKVPKPRGSGGGQSSWYNSETGVRFTQERTDRRTALMQAVAWCSNDTTGEVSQFDVLRLTDEFYAWLRSSSEAPTTRGAAEGEGASPPSTVDTSIASPRTEESTSGGGGAREASAPVACVHTDTSPLNPKGVALPDGKVRCLACGAVVKEVARAES